MSFIAGAVGSRRFKFSLRSAFGVLVLAAVVPSVAQAAVTQSSITAPADPYYAIWNEQVATPNVTVSGTSNGTTGDAVDIRCYHDTGSTGTSQGVLASNVPVSANGSFGTTVPQSSLESDGGGECRLRAVPHSSTPTSGLGAYTGPRTLVGDYQIDDPGTFSVPSDYYVASNELGAQDQYDSIGGCGIDGSYLMDPTTFGVTHTGPWGCNDWTHEIAQSNSSQGGIEIDGAAAYGPAGAEEINDTLSALPSIVVNSVSENPTTGDLTIDETDPLVRCLGNAAPLAQGSGACSTFVTAGVSDHRIISQTDSGHTVTIADYYSSTDGSSHTVSLRLENDQTLGTPANTAYEFPGQSSFSPGTSGEQVTASGGVPATIYIENTNYSEPSTSAIRAAVTYYQTPSGPFTFETGGYVGDFDALNSFTVPATGSVPIRYSYSYDYTLAAVQQEVGAAEDANDPPAATISSPVAGADVSSSPVTVTGTASAGSGVSGVTVNGVTATLSGTSWTATVALTPGQNTITVTVTSQTGATSTTTETIDYSTPQSTTPGTTPTTGADGVGLSAKALDVGVSVSGSGGLQLPLVCPQTPTGCDADGTLTLALASSSSQARFDHAITPIHDSVLARFAGLEIQSGQSRLVSVKLTPAATRYLQTRGVRRVQVTLTIHNHLSGGADVTTQQLVWLNIAALRASCPAAVGTLTGSSIGSLRLGLARSRAHRLGPHHRTHYGFERYCLSSGAVRVGYTTKALLHFNPGVTGQRAGSVALALTGNRHYSTHGIKSQMTVSAARRRLQLGDGLKIGKNTWYFSASRHATTVIKAQAGVVREIGIANPKLSLTPTQQRILLRHV